MSQANGFAPAQISQRKLARIVSIHAEEAAFLFSQRQSAVISPRYALKDLAKLDRRLEAHLDGLRVAGADGWQACAGALESGGAGELFAAAVLACGADDEARFTQVLAAVGAAPEHSNALVSALAWLPEQQVARRLANLASSTEPELRRIALASYSARRLDPGVTLAEAAFDAHAPLRSLALRSAGELGRGDLQGALLRSLHDIGEDARVFAAWSLARMGDRGEDVLDALLRVAEGDGPHADRALELWVRCTDSRRLGEWLRATGSDAPSRRRFVRAIGAAGLASLVPELFPLMEDDALAKVAGESFTRVTGVDLEYADLDREPGADAEADEEEVPTSSADDALPLPERAAVEAWWQENRARFDSRGVYLLGRPKSVSAFRMALLEGRQRERAAAALELALLDPSRPLYEVRARGDRQLAEERQWTS